MKTNVTLFERCIILALAAGVAFATGIAHGGWVASPPAPPGGQVFEAINTGSAEQIKNGDLGVRDAWIADAGAWAGEQWQLKLFSPSQLDNFSSPFFTVPVASGGPQGNLQNPPYTGWKQEIITTVGAYQTAFNSELPNVRRLVKALVFKTVCGNGMLWITGENPAPATVPNYSSNGTPPWAGEWRLACNDAANARDVNTVIVPITTQSFGTGINYLVSTIPYYYHVDPLASNNAGALFKPFVIGFYYQDIPFTPPETP